MTRAAFLFLLAATAVRAQTPDPPSRADVLLRAETDRRTAVVGQQVGLTMRIFVGDNASLSRPLPLGTWDTPGLWREAGEDGVQYAGTESVGGRTYTVYTMERYALYPTRAGTFTIPARRIEITLETAAPPDPNDPFGAFFAPFRTTRERIELATRPITLSVSDPPGGAPPGFGGAVGTFDLTSTVDRTTAAVDEPVLFQITLRGTGNLATLSAPVLPDVPGATVYGPTDERDVDRQADPLVGVKTFTYTLVPERGGTLRLPAVPWTYYDAAAQTYRTLATAPVAIDVAGSGRAAVPAAGALTLATAARWRRGPSPTGWLWAALALGVALPLGTWAAARTVRTRRQQRTRRPATADDRLALAGRTAGAAGYAAIDHAVRTALAARTGAPAAMPRADWARELAARGIADDTAGRLTAVLAAAEQGRFAPGLGAPPPAALAHQAREALAALHR